MLSPSDTQAIRLSLQVTAAATIIFGAPGVWLGIWLARSHARWRGAVQVITMLPLVLPPVVTGLCLLEFFLWTGIPLAFTWWAAALASGVVAMPLLVRTVQAGAETLDARLPLAAATLGASTWRVFWTITLPLSWKAIVAGLTLFWVRSLGEFGAVMVVASNTPGRTQTIPLAIYSRLESTRSESIWPLTLAAVALSLAATIVSEYLVRTPSRIRPPSN